MVKARIVGEGERVVEGVGTVRELLSKLGIASSEAVVLRNGIILTEEDALSDGDEVLIYIVKSGG
ncbi:MoaD/ThiS family protein [Thermogladius sp. 4427co]|uniref:MoaD/ThiS family protein n=1 Tax=Thermogladius sp. 4427co TaxID=3450718 RepID=UPI003F78D262